MRSPPHTPSRPQAPTPRRCRRSDAVNSRQVACARTPGNSQHGLPCPSNVQAACESHRFCNPRQPLMHIEFWPLEGLKGIGASARLVAGLHFWFRLEPQRPSPWPCRLCRRKPQVEVLAAEGDCSALQLLSRGRTSAAAEQFESTLAASPGAPLAAPDDSRKLLLSEAASSSKAASCT